jgi:ABC-type polysaccharide/polyol phosphate export permease
MQQTCQVSDAMASYTLNDSRRVEPAESATPEFRHGIISDLSEVVHEIWQFRELLYQFVLRDLRVRYKQSVMGIAWTIFMPTMVILSGIVVRFAVGHLTATGVNASDVLGLAVKALTWSFFVGSVNFATTSIVNNESLVTKNFFPREVFPLSAVIAQSVDSAIAAGILFVLIPIFLGGPAWTWLWLLMLLPMMICLTSSVALLLSCGNLFFRDVKYIVQVFLTFGIFFTPVLFEPAMFGETGSLMMMLNPLAPIMEGLRLSLIVGHDLAINSYVSGPNGSQVLVWTPWYLAYSGIWAVVGLVFSSIVFHRCEFLFAEYV